MPLLEFAPLVHPGLILNRNELDAVREKARTTEWAGAALKRLLEGADRWVSEDIRIPDSKGQWWHYYVCAQDGTRLQTDSDTEHRCPACGKVYSGEPYDSVVAAGRHGRLARAARDLGLAYQLTGRDEYLHPARQIVLRYADRYLSYPLIDYRGKPDSDQAGRVCSTNLAESVWLLPMCWAYDLVAEHLTDDERRHVCDDMLRPGGIVVGRHERGIHNIRCWMNSAKGLAALCCGDGELAHQAIRAEFGLENQLANGVLGDGFWWECSWGYHFYTMSALWPLAEAVRHIGVDVYGDRYRALYDAPLDFAFPGLYLPPLNDSGEGRILSGETGELYETAYARWGDRRHAGVLQNLERKGLLSLCFGVPELDAAPPEARTSVNFPDAGIAVLRSGDQDPAVVTLDYGPHGGGHGHPDKLGIILFGAGREMAPDPGSILYRAPLHLQWFKTTLSHNTLLVDMAPQAPCTGTLHEFHTDGEVQLSSASADDAYPGVQFRRTVALLPGCIVLDLCQAQSDTEHVYDWVYHNRGEFSSPLRFEGLPAPLGEANGYQHVSSPRVAHTSNSWAARWHDQDAGVALAVAGEPGTEVIAGEGPGNPPPLLLPMVVVRRKGKQATFAAAYVVYRGGAPMVELSVGAGTDGLCRLSVSVDGDARVVDMPCLWSPHAPQGPAGEPPGECEYA